MNGKHSKYDDNKVYNTVAISYLLCEILSSPKSLIYTIKQKLKWILFIINEAFSTEDYHNIKNKLLRLFIKFIDNATITSRAMNCNALDIHPRLILEKILDHFIDNWIYKK